MSLRWAVKRILFIVPLIGFLILATIAAAVLNRGKTHEAAHVPMAPVIKDYGSVPPFAITAMKDADLSGETRLLTFFASWCMPCIAEHPVLMHLSQKIPVYGIDFMDKPDKLAEFLKNGGNPYKKLGQDNDGLSGVAFGVTGIPVSFVINKQGHIIYRHDGPLSLDDADNIILPLIKKTEAEKNP